jgi:hypothetical protein
MRVQNGLSIGCDPGQEGYTFDSVGSFRVQDGYGQINLSNYFELDGAAASNSVVNINSVNGGTMTLNVAGTTRASNAFISNQVSAGIGYYSVQSGAAGVVINTASTLTIPLKNNGLVVTSVYNSAATPVCYIARHMRVDSSTVPIQLDVITVPDEQTSYTVTLTATTITISNSVASATFRYNVTFFPIG